MIDIMLDFDDFLDPCYLKFSVEFGFEMCFILMHTFGE